MIKISYDQLNVFAKYRTDKIKTIELTPINYISTENMIQDRGGVIISSNIPESNSQCKFEENDILLSNIRPYF